MILDCDIFHYIVIYFIKESHNLNMLTISSKLSKKFGNLMNKLLLTRYWRSSSLKTKFFLNEDAKTQNI